jgi:hypothetical protein
VSTRLNSKLKRLAFRNWLKPWLSSSGFEEQLSALSYQLQFPRVDADVVIRHWDLLNGD